MGPVGVGTGTGVVVLIGTGVVDTPETLLSEEEPETVLGEEVFVEMLEPEMTEEGAMELELEELEELEQGMESHPGLYLVVS